MSEINMLAVQAQIEANTWTFAKTMPHIPHFYAIRQRWVMTEGGMDFSTMLQFIRDHGRMMAWGSKEPKPYLFLNGWKYWTMGDPVDETIVLNRERARYDTPYDEMAIGYDAVYETEDHRQENELAFEAAKVSGRVLDIGCGTGLAINYIDTNPERYVGIDPSFGMLRQFSQRHPDYKNSLICSEFQDYCGEKFDTIISMFGAGSYLQAGDCERITSMLNSGGRAFVMSYTDGYTPDLYKKNGVPMAGLICPDGISPMFGKYVVDQWVKE